MSYREYMQEIDRSRDAGRLNALIEDAAFNPDLTDTQYDEIYYAALDKAVCC